MTELLKEVHHALTITQILGIIKTLIICLTIYLSISELARAVAGKLHRNKNERKEQ
jgi:hypothetical protein